MKTASRHGRASRLAVGLTAVVLALTAAACGDDDDDDSSSGTSTPAAATAAPEATTAPAGTESDTTSAPDEGTSETTAATEETEPEGAESANEGGDITWMVFIAMASLDPKLNDVGGTCCDAGQIYGLYDSLIRVDTEGNITPRLATSVTSDPTFKTWTIELRPDVTFTDGTPFDAEAVKVNMERHKDPAVASRCILQAMEIATVTVDSPTELTVDLTESNSQFPIRLQGCLGLIASPTALEQYGAEYGSTADKAVGAGPFTVESFSPNVDSVLVRNPDFWDAPRPYLDRIHIVSAAANAQTAVDALATGQAQLATFMGAPGPPLKAVEEAGYDSIVSKFFGGQGFGFNTTKPPLDDPRVRRALTIAIDPAALNEQVFAGSAPRDDTFYPEDSPYYDASLTYPEYDMEEAQRLIDDYLAEKGGTVDVKMTANELMSPVGVFAKQQYDQLEGVNFTIDVVPSAAVGDAYFSRSFQTGGMLLAGATGYPTFSDNLSADSPVAFTGYTNPDIDAANASVLTTDDPDEIAAAYQEIARIVLDDLPYGIMWPQPSNTYWTDELQGVEVFRSHNVDLTLLNLT